MWLKCKNKAQRQRLKAEYVQKRKHFDKSVQRRKRNYQYEEQQNLLKACNNTNRHDFWKEIGNIGIGKERNKLIPIEVILEDGTISTLPQQVLDKWKKSF